MGSTNCEEVGCIKDTLNLPHYSGYDYCPAVHTEKNAVINATRNENSLIDGTLYLYGIDAKTNRPVAGMPCPRCKRVLINAGIKEVVTIDESVNIIKYDVKSWVEEDKNGYLDVVEKVKKNQPSK
jgi:dCMP deaminase